MKKEGFSAPSFFSNLLPFLAFYFLRFFLFFEEFAPLFRGKNSVNIFCSFSFFITDSVKETASKGICCSWSPLVLAHVA
jgi:hypothetical protein